MGQRTALWGGHVFPRLGVWHSQITESNAEQTSAAQLARLPCQGGELVTVLRTLSASASNIWGLPKKRPKFKNFLRRLMHREVSWFEDLNLQSCLGREEKPSLKMSFIDLKLSCNNNALKHVVSRGMSQAATILKIKRATCSLATRHVRGGCVQILLILCVEETCGFLNNTECLSPTQFISLSSPCICLPVIR